MIYSDVASDAAALEQGIPLQLIFHIIPFSLIEVAPLVKYGLPICGRLIFSASDK
jgi:hypothetical protein